MVISVIISFILIYIGFYIVRDDTDVNDKKNKDTNVKVINIIIRLLLVIFVALILIGASNIDKFIK